VSDPHPTILLALLCAERAVRSRPNPAESHCLQLEAQDLDYTFVYPAGSKDTLTFTAQLGTDYILDARQDDTLAESIAFASEITADGSSGTSGQGATLHDGTAGFFGLGVYQVGKALTARLLWVSLCPWKRHRDLALSARHSSDTCRPT
jgi:hypothetical protein